MSLGPLNGLRVADLSAEVIGLERPAGGSFIGEGSGNLLNRGRPSVGIDLKKPDAVELTLEPEFYARLLELLEPSSEPPG